MSVSLLPDMRVELSCGGKAQDDHQRSVGDAPGRIKFASQAMILPFSWTHVCFRLVSESSTRSSHLEVWINKVKEPKTMPITELSLNKVQPHKTMS